jgi:transposase
MEEPQPAMDKITQEMKYRYSLVNYALKYGVSKASRRYNRARSYIYYWLKRFDGAIGSLAVKSRRPHHHPNQHTQDEIALIIRCRRRNAELGLLEFWFKLRKQGYTRHYVSLYRVERREGLERSIKPRQKGSPPKPYEADAVSRPAGTN